MCDNHRLLLSCPFLSGACRIISWASSTSATSTCATPWRPSASAGRKGTCFSAFRAAVLSLLGLSRIVYTVTTLCV
jgi:hypothetical protein